MGRLCGELIVIIIIIKACWCTNRIKTNLRWPVPSLQLQVNAHPEHSSWGRLLVFRCHSEDTEVAVRQPQLASTPQNARTSALAQRGTGQGGRGKGRSLLRFLGHVISLE